MDSKKERKKKAFKSKEKNSFLVFPHTEFKDGRCNIDFDRKIIVKKDVCWNTIRSHWDEMIKEDQKAFMTEQYSDAENRPQCPRCHSNLIVSNGGFRWLCKSCGKQFNKKPESLLLEHKQQEGKWEYGTKSQKK